MPSEIDNYELSNKAPENIKDLLNQIEFLFAKYLKDKEKNNSLISELVKEKWWLLVILKEVYWDKFDWESEEKFNIEKLSSFLDKISEIWEEIYRSNPELEIIIDTVWWDSPIWLAWKQFFENPNIVTNDISLMEWFFRYHLKKQWILETEETKERLKEVMFNGNFFYFIKEILWIVVSITWISESKENWNNLIQLLLLISSKVQNYSRNKLESFMDSVNNTFKNKGNIDELEVFINLLLEQIKVSFPDIYWKEHTLYKVEVILLWEFDENSKDSYYVNLLPTDNFYFRKDEENIQIESDNFPIEWKIIDSYQGRLDGMKNVNIFNTEWKKVFWWDVSEEDIKNLVWTYYILGESEWWRDVPKFAQWNIEWIRPAKDEIWEERRKNIPILEGITIPNDVPYINPDYIRVNARWKIQNWKYIKNSTQISLK